MLTNNVTTIIMNQKSLLVYIAIFELFTLFEFSLLVQKIAVTPRRRWQVGPVCKIYVQCLNIVAIAAYKQIVVAQKTNIC